MSVGSELKSFGWELKEVFKHEATRIPERAGLCAKMYFAPVVGLLKGHPVSHIKQVFEERYMWEAQNMEQLKKKLDTNPYATARM